LQGEGAYITKARAEGLVQDFFIKADRGGLVKEPKQAANNILRTKPIDGGDMTAATSQVMAGADLKGQLARGAFNGSWTLVPGESSVRLKAKAMWGIVPVKGTFSELAGSAAVATDGGVTGRLEVKSASINTKMKKRDEHLPSDDFFACDRFSDIVFEIDQVTSTTSGLTVEGRLTVRERTIRLEFPAFVTDLGSGQMGIDTELQVDRAELGLSYRGKGATKMNNELIIHAVFARP